MSGQFVLTIRLANEEMSKPRHVADALAKIAGAFHASERPYYGDVRDSGAIFDVNGNTVGHWTATWPSESDFIPAEDEDEDEVECQGHESLEGEHMGETVYCDGSCEK